MSRISGRFFGKKMHSDIFCRILKGDGGWGGGVVQSRKTV